MLYYLFDWLDSSFDFPGAGVFQYISFRAAAAVITSLLITIVFGKKLINFLRRKQVGETVRDLGLEGQKAKEGTPTMGGLIILAAILVPTLLFAKLDNIYVIIMLITTIWLGALGFVDDYIKVFRNYFLNIICRYYFFFLKNYIIYCFFSHFNSYRTMC